MNTALRCAIVALLCPSPALAAWTLERRTAPGTGETATSVSLTSEDVSIGGAADAQRTARLVVQCWQKRMSVIVAFPEPLAAPKALTVRLGYRIGPEEVAPSAVGVSGNGRATGWWNTPEALAVISKMRLETHLALSVEGDRRAQARFALEGFSDAVAPVLAACGQ